jgi:hypothetical protein
LGARPQSDKTRFLLFAVWICAVVLFHFIGHR